MVICGEFVAFPVDTTSPPHIELETPFAPFFSVSLLLMQTAITTLGHTWRRRCLTGQRSRTIDATFSRPSRGAVRLYSEDSGVNSLVTAAMAKEVGKSPKPLKAAFSNAGLQATW